MLHEKPLRRFERVLAEQLAAFPRSSRSFSREVFTWLGDRLWIKSRLASDLDVDPSQLYFSGRALSFAASAFFATEFDDAAILVVDGDGEWATTSFAVARDSRIELLFEMHHPHSLVLALRAIAKWLGFGQPGGEALVEALATLGTASHAQAMSQFVRVGDAARIELDDRGFVSDLNGGLACGPAWIAAFGSARHVGDALLHSSQGSRHADLAASFQAVLADAVLALARELAQRVSSNKLCFVGALANNATIVAKLAEHGPFDEVFVPPWCDESALAIGAAWYGSSSFEPGVRPTATSGFRFGEAALLEPTLAKVTGCSAEVVVDEYARVERMAAALRSGRTVGWVRGRVEYGTDPIEARLVLADPRRHGIVKHLADSILRREEFLPFTAVVASERAEEFFVVPPSLRSTIGGRIVSLAATSNARRYAPEWTGSCERFRVRFVTRAQDAALHSLLSKFGEPMLLAAPLAPRSEPVVRGERDAVSFLERSALDLLVVEDRVYERS